MNASAFVDPIVDSPRQVAITQALCRDTGEDPRPGPAAPQTRPETEADGVISMMSPGPAADPPDPNQE